MPDPTMRDAIQAMAEQRMVALAEQYQAGTITLATFQEEMRLELRRAYALEIIAANDGAMPPSEDWLALGNPLKSQYLYLEDFSRGVRDGQIDSATMAQRSVLYARSSKAAYWQEVTKQANLPAQPCDGSTRCLGNCLCEWVPNDDGSWTWDRTNEKGTSCPDCIRRAQDWAHYVPEAA